MQIKLQAQNHPSARKLAAGLGRKYDAFSQRLDAVFSGQRLKELKPVTDAHALTMGTELISQAFLLSTALGLVFLEYWRNNKVKEEENAIKKAEKAQRQQVKESRLARMEAMLAHLETRLAAITPTLGAEPTATDPLQMPPRRIDLEIPAPQSISVLPSAPPVSPASHSRGWLEWFGLTNSQLATPTAPADTPKSSASSGGAPSNIVSASIDGDGGTSSPSPSFDRSFPSTTIKAGIVPLDAAAGVLMDVWKLLVSLTGCNDPKCRREVSHSSASGVTTPPTNAACGELK